MRKKMILYRILILAGALLLESAAYGAPVHTPEYKKVCGKVITDDGKPRNSGIPQQKVTYCSAAQSADQTIIPTEIGIGLFGAVAGVCTAACFYPYPALTQSCTWSNVGASLTDAVQSAILTEQFETAATSLAGAAPGALLSFTNAGGSTINWTNASQVQAQSQQVLADPTATPAAKEAAANNLKDAQSAGDGYSVDVASCVSALLAAGQVALKTYGLTQSIDTRDENLKNAKKFSDKDKQIVDLKKNKIQKPQDGSLAETRGAIDHLDYADAQSALEPVQAESCSQALASGDASGMIACAAATGQAPHLGYNPEFEKTFKDVMGQDLGSFMKEFSQSGKLASDVMGKAFSGGNAENAAKINESFKSIERQVASAAQADPNLFYLASRGSKKKKKDMGDQVGDIMSSLLGQLQSPQAEKKAGFRSGEIEFKLANRSPAQIMEDRSMSLFSRVEYRYRKSKPKLTELPWASPYNRAILSPR